MGLPSLGYYTWLDTSLEHLRPCRSGKRRTPPRLYNNRTILLESIAYIHNKTPNPIIMDARRYDRNADLLSQIYWHLDKVSHHSNEIAEAKRLRFLVILQECLKLNDALGEMAEKGLIWCLVAGQKTQQLPSASPSQGPFLTTLT